MKDKFGRELDAGDKVLVFGRPARIIFDKNRLWLDDGNDGGFCCEEKYIELVEKNPILA